MAESESSSSSLDSTSEKPDKLIDYLTSKSNIYKLPEEVVNLISLINQHHLLETNSFFTKLLVSSCDALDIINFPGLTTLVLKTDEIDKNKLCIEITLNEEKRILTITNNGCGMNESTLLKSFGVTFANKSYNFKSNTPEANPFNISFKPVFIVADAITVITKHTYDKYTLHWPFCTKEHFSLKCDVGRQLSYGTEIILKIKEDCLEYITETKIRKEINEFRKVHPAYNQYRIEIKIEKESMRGLKTEIAVPVENVVLAEHIKNIDLGTLLTHDEKANLMMMSFDIKDNLKGAFFIPFYTNLEKSKKASIEVIFNNRIIDEELPLYLNFIKAIAYCNAQYSDDNETILKLIRDYFVAKVLNYLREEASKNKEFYRRFYCQYGKNIEQGLQEDSANLVYLVRLHTSSGKEWRFLQEYIKNMKENQSHIYFISGKDMKQIANSPFTEYFKKRDIEVIYMTEPFNKYILQLKIINEKPLLSVTEDELVFPKNINEEIDYLNTKKKYKNFCNHLKFMLSTKVKSVRISKRLVESPCCVVMSTNTTTIEKKNNNAQTDTIKQNMLILEINLEHIIFKKLRKVENIWEVYIFWDIMEILFGTALLLSGFTLNDPNEYVRYIYDFIEMNMVKGPDTEDDEMLYDTNDVL